MLSPVHLVVVANALLQSIDTLLQPIDALLQSNIQYGAFIFFLYKMFYDMKNIHISNYNFI
jgi:hypothetical protein